jgi:hypothetical protein
LLSPFSACFVHINPSYGTNLSVFAFLLVLAMNVGMLIRAKCWNRTDPIAEVLSCTRWLPLLIFFAYSAGNAATQIDQLGLRPGSWSAQSADRYMQGLLFFLLATVVLVAMTLWEVRRAVKRLEAGAEEPSGETK